MGELLLAFLAVGLFSSALGIVASLWGFYVLTFALLPASKMPVKLRGGGAITAWLAVVYFGLQGLELLTRLPRTLGGGLPELLLTLGLTYSFYKAGRNLSENTKGAAPWQFHSSKDAVKGAEHLVLLIQYVHEGREGDYHGFESRVLAHLVRAGGRLVRIARLSPCARGLNAPYEMQLLAFPNEELFQLYLDSQESRTFESERELVVARLDAFSGPGVPVSVA